MAPAFRCGGYASSRQGASSFSRWMRLFILKTDHYSTQERKRPILDSSHAQPSDTITVDAIAMDTKVHGVSRLVQAGDSFAQQITHSSTNYKTFQ